MSRVAGVDGAPGGWAVVTLAAGMPSVQRITRLSDLLAFGVGFDLIAVDMPIGLLDAYEIGGRHCDREARRLLGKRGSSVFPAPVRAVFGSMTHEEACARSIDSSPHRKAISRQAFGILPKIEEVDQLLQTRRELRAIVREVHPEVSFQELTGASLAHRKVTRAGREERKVALATVFPWLDDILLRGRAQKLATEDVLDACVACWSATRLLSGAGYSLPASAPTDSTGLPMAIWV